MEENLNINQLIKVEQLPKVYEQLEIIGTFIDNQLADIDTMEVTEENKQEVKKRKAEINSLNTIMEDKRKAIKKQILEPYEQFNEKYEETIKVKLLHASIVLKDKIDKIENEQKNQKENEIKEFALEYIKNLHLESIVDYESIKPNITLSASMKSLKDGVKERLEQIANEVALLRLEDLSDEILLEYKNNGYDYIYAKLDVIERHKKLEELRKEQESAEEKQHEEEKIEETVEEITAPVEEDNEIPENDISDDQVMVYTFTVTGTRNQIIQVRDYLRQEGISYE